MLFDTVQGIMTQKPEPESPVVLLRGDHPISRKQFTPGTLDVLYRLSQAGYTAYIAGGGVRDLLVGRTPKDFDIATNARPEQVRRLFRNCRLVGRRFRLAHVFYRAEMIEVSTFRAGVSEESEASHFHKKTDEGLIVRDNIYGTPMQDAWRRDFTVNALFYNIRDFSVIDHVGGLNDIDARLIRMIGDPEVRLVEDPVRMIRAARFAGTLGFEIESATKDAIVHLAGDIAKASPARMFEEVQKLFLCGHSRAVIGLLRSLGLLVHMLPELDAALNDSADDGRWIEQVTGQFDTWRQHGVSVSPELMFALLFGSVHERAIAGQIANGLPRFPAADLAVSEHFRTLSTRVSIPRAIGRHIAQIMAVQPMLEAMKTGKAGRLMQRSFFHDAFIYFKMRARFENAREEAVHFWADRLRRHG